MKLLEDRIAKDGIIYEGNVLKVDSFLNHQLDIPLFSELAKELVRLFAGCGINKILTIEASGIGLASIAAYHFGCPMVFAKKAKTSNLSPDLYTARVHSYTHGTDHDIVVSKAYLGAEDTVLIIDDFLAMGEALRGLISIVQQSGAALAGCGIAIEKAFQQGGKLLREQGVRIESLARIESMDPKRGITFC